MKHKISFNMFSLVASVLLTAIMMSNGTSGAIFSDVHWTTAIKLSEYVGYRSVTLLSFSIPEQTLHTVMSFQGQTVGKGCSFQEVHVYFQHGSYPVVNPYNETFPERFYTNRTSLHHFVIHNNDGASTYFLSTPWPGTWYFAAFIPKSKNSKIRPPALKGSCSYGMFVILESQGIDTIEEMAFGQPEQISLVNTPARREVSYRYSVPVGTVAYSLTASACTIKYINNTSAPAQQCPITISIQPEALPSENSSSVNCHERDACQFDVFSPVLKKWTYLVVVLEQLENVTSVSLKLDFTVKSCMVYQSVFPPTLDLMSSPADPIYNITHDSCVLIDGLGRFVLSKFDFNVTFAIPDTAIYPKPIPDNSLLVPDYTSVVTRFRIDPIEDIGGTLKVGLAAADPIVLNIKQSAIVYLCLMKHRIPGSVNTLKCDGGISLNINVTETAVDYLYMPYPEPGEWFLGLYSQCFDKDTGNAARCIHFPQVLFDVELSSCVDSQCGEFGNCREYFSGVHVFSTCSCIAGWRGYGCSDGTEAVPYSTELTAVLLLTLSNLFFIPAIILATYRHFFVEAIVYFFTMFFSLFYHACDTSDWLQYCMMQYDVLQFSDFFGSILSFWVTLLAMAEISPRLRAVCHMVGVLGIAIGVEYRKHGIWAFVAPAGLGLIIMVASWIRQCKIRHQIFPPKRRYFTNLLPGIVLAGTGLIIFAFLETDDNYKYTHSAWHVVISSSIVFLLPKRRNTKEPVLSTDRADLLAGSENGSEQTLIPTARPRQPDNLIL